MEHVLVFFNHTDSIHIYGIIVLLLLAGSIGFPFPEDIIFLTVGYVAYKGFINPHIGIVVGLLGVLTADSVIYFLGYKFGLKIFSIPILNKIVTEKALAKARKLLHKHGSKFIFFSKYIVGVRYSVFFASGTLSVDYGRFVLFDSLASSIYTPVLVYVAYFNGGSIDKILSSVRNVEYVLLAVALIVISILVTKNYLKKTRNSFAE